MSTVAQGARVHERSFAWSTNASIIAALAGLTALGLALRIATFDQTLLGDELSTYWIVNDHSLGDVLSSVRSNDEITPPLYFILGWLSVQPDWGPEWIRLPSLIAGTLTIPLVYLLGARTISRASGLLGAALIALSPFMIYYSVEARAYALMIALLVGSTLALLAALATRRARWWVIYAACSCAAMFSHYTAAFPLVAQFAWVLWAHREAVRPLLLANVAALIGFAPWIPGFIADNNSPTTAILAALSPFTFEGVKTSVEAWAIGYPYVGLDSLPGNLARGLFVGGLVVATVAGAVRAVRWLRGSDLSLVAGLRRVPPGVVLIALLALATPVGEAIYSALGSDILGARNLNASWPGLAVGIGALLAAAGPVLGVACAAAVISAFGVAAVKTLDAESARVDYKRVASLIEQRWEPGDVVVDAATLTPVPLTALDVYLPQTNPEFRLDLPQVDHALTPLDPVPDPDRMITESLSLAEGRSLFLVAGLPEDELLDSTTRVAEVRQEREDLGVEVLRRAEARFEVAYEREIPGVGRLALYELRDRDAGAGAGRPAP